MGILIVLPVYQVEKYVHRCIDSILSQSFRDYELVLVDDGSSDESGYYCDEYAEKNDQVIVIHKKNGGLSDARNVGIDWSFQISESKWITFIDSDDWIHSKYLELLYDSVTQTGCQISVCDYKEMTDDLSELDAEGINTRTEKTEDFFCGHTVRAVVAWGKLYLKTLFRDIRYPFGKLHEDEFTTYKLLFKNPTVSAVDAPLYYYYQNPKSITQSGWTPRSLDGIEAIENSIRFFRKNKFRNAYVKSVRKLEWGINTQFESMKKNSEYCSKHYFTLFSEYYRRLLRYGKKEGMFPFSGYIRYYETAYPKTMKYYWIICGIKRKLFRR